MLCIIVLVSITFFSSALAEEETPFVFRNGITWGMSVEEVQEKEGVWDIEAFYNYDFNCDVFPLLGVTVSDFEASLAYCFKDSQLFSCIYAVVDPYSNPNIVFDCLIQSLSKKYGTPEICSDLVFQHIIDHAFAPDLFSPDSNIFQYSTEDDTWVFCFLDDMPSIVYLPNTNLINTNGL